MISKKKYGSIFLLLLCAYAQPCHSQMKPWYRPAAVRGGFSLVRQDAAQIDGSGVGPGGFIGLRFEPSKRLFLVAGMGLYQALDDFFNWDRRYVDLLPTVELKTGYVLFNMDRIKPYLNVGLQLSHSVMSEMKDDIGIEKHKQMFLGYTAGGGVRYNFYTKYSFFVEGEFRKNFQEYNLRKQVYWIATAGISFRLSPPHVEKRDDYKDFLYRANDESIGLFEGIFQDKYIENAEFREFFLTLEEVVERTYPGGKPEDLGINEPIFDIISEVTLSEEMSEINMVNSFKCISSKPDYGLTMSLFRDFFHKLCFKKSTL